LMMSGSSTAASLLMCPPLP